MTKFGKAEADRQIADIKRQAKDGLITRKEAARKIAEIKGAKAELATDRPGRQLSLF